MNLVVDASAILEILLQTPKARTLSRRVLKSGLGLHAPHLLDLEVLQVLRRLEREGRLAPDRAQVSADLLADFPLQRQPVTALIARIWALRQNMTAYDAAYVALAEALDAPLVTCDARLGRAPGHAARIEVV